jgi:hypothetical protein
MNRRGPRRRASTACSLGGVIALGLASRRWPLPGLLAEHTGDALYTVAAFLSFALVLPRRSRMLLAGLAFASSSLVECSQLLDHDLLLLARSSRLGGWILGHGFQWADFVAYLAGAAVAFVSDPLLPRGQAAPQQEAT